MTELKFKIGDTVRLKGDTHKMTIEELPEEKGDYYTCVWMDKLTDGTKRKGHDYFAEEALELIK